MCAIVCAIVGFKLKFLLYFQDPNFRGKGTSDGSPYYNCGKDNAVYVTMDKIFKKANSKGSSTTSDVENLSEKNPITIEPKLSGHSKSSNDRPADNLRSSRDKGKTLIEKAKDNWSKFTGFNNATHASVPSDVPCEVPSRFSSGDRVILQSAKGGIVKGMVKWVGPMRMSRETGSLVISMIGIETVSGLVIEYTHTSTFMQLLD